MQASDLTYHGWEEAQDHATLCLIACGALAHEILAIIEINQFKHITLRCLPAILHNTPEDIPNAVEKKIHEARADGFEHIKLAYADCGTGGTLERLCASYDVEMIEGAHCYAFFQGVETAAQQDDVTSFFLTDFLARQFDAFVWKPLGLDRHPDLRDMYFGNYEKLVYLRQNEALGLTARAKECAQKLGLKFEVRDTGYGELSAFVETTAST